MTTIDTPAPTLGVGRCLGFILGALPWPGGLVTRITLVSLVPERLAAANRTPFPMSVKTWLRKANTTGRIRRGEYVVQPVDRAGLFAEATRNLDGWRARIFSTSARRFAGSPDARRTPRRPCWPSG
jgi:hypothetical protein